MDHRTRTPLINIEYIVDRFAPPTFRQQMDKKLFSRQEVPLKMEAEFTIGSSSDIIVSKVMEMVKKVDPEQAITLKATIDAPDSLHKILKVSLTPEQFLTMVASDPLARKCNPFKRLSRTEVLKTQWETLLAQYGALAESDSLAKER